MDHSEKYRRRVRVLTLCRDRGLWPVSATTPRPAKSPRNPSMTTGAVSGVEALVRWQHPRFGVLEPAQFLPLVREHGLMHALTDLVLSRAVADAAAWYEADAAIPVAINLAAPSLDKDALPDRIMSVSTHTRCLPVCSRLRSPRIWWWPTWRRPARCSIVCARTAFGILHDDRAAIITHSVIELASAFGIATVAEGVEDLATAQRLKDYGCDAVQGNLFCPPLPASEIRRVSGISTLAAQ